jgi:hypothetical protein
MPVSYPSAWNQRGAIVLMATFQKAEASAFVYVCFGFFFFGGGGVVNYIRRIINNKSITVSFLRVILD